MSESDSVMKKGRYKFVSFYLRLDYAGSKFEIFIFFPLNIFDPSKKTLELSQHANFRSDNR